MEPTRSARPAMAGLLLLAVGAGCTDRLRQDPLDPVDSVLALSGVEHVVEVETARTGAPRWFVLIRSTLWNRGGDAVTLRVRPCLGRTDIRGEDAEPWFSGLVPESRASGRPEHLQLWFTSSFPACTEREEEITLGPGESSGTLVLRGSAPDSHPGGGPPAWQVRIRHSLAPEQWTPVTLNAP